MNFIFICKNCGQRILNYNYKWLLGNKVEVRWKHFRNDLNCPKAEK